MYQSGYQVDLPEMDFNKTLTEKLNLASFFSIWLALNYKMYIVLMKTRNRIILFGGFLFADEMRLIAGIFRDNIIEYFLKP